MAKSSFRVLDFGRCPGCIRSPSITVVGANLDAPRIFVEDVAYFPEGSNDLEYYHHVLHHVILLDGLDGSMEYTYPSTWDGDDMTAILIVDWVEEENEDNFFPGPSMILTKFCFLISSLFYSKNK